MLDPKLLRADIKAVATQMQRRNLNIDSALFNQLEQQRKQLQQITEQLQAKRNANAKAIGQAKAKQQNTDQLMQTAKEIGEQAADNERQLATIQQQLKDFMLELPNILEPDVPTGSSEAENKIIKTWGNIPKFDFEPQDHVQLGEQHNWLDFNAAARLTGARFIVMRDKMARLHRALIQFMLDFHTQNHAYQEVYTPYIVNSDSLIGTGQLPKFAADLFKLEGLEQDYYLIPTAEVPVTNLLRQQIVSKADLPLKFVAHTPCFRSEAGSYGQDTRGMIRQHQFEKVELVQFALPEDSMAALEDLTANAEAILEALKLPYQRVLLCSGDTGFSSAKTYDLEVWLPAQNTYREISSCSNFKDFQARRMGARYKDAANKNQLLHTLNGSGLAIGRTLVAILENYQQQDGSIVIPQALVKYTGFERLEV